MDLNFDLKKDKEIKIKNIIPNILTILSICSGLTSVRMALENRWEAAILAILIAAILDGMDGRIARMLKVTSVLGVELDSFADFVSFGIAPAFLVYCFSLNINSRFGWGAVIFYITCMALRLARFNLHQLDVSDQNLPAWTKKYFVGVPAPAGALIVVMPMNLYLATGWDCLCFFTLNFLFLLFTGCLLISKLPVYSPKYISFQFDKLYLYIIFSVLCAISLYTQTWFTLFVIGCMLLISIPLSYRDLKKNNFMS